MDTDALDKRSYIEGHWFTDIGSTLEYVTESETGEIYVEAAYAPVGLMATLAQPVEGGSYHFSDLKAGASISYGLLSCSATQLITCKCES